MAVDSGYAAGIVNISETDAIFCGSIELFGAEIAEQSGKIHKTKRLIKPSIQEPSHTGSSEDGSGTYSLHAQQSGENGLGARSGVQVLLAVSLIVALMTPMVLKAGMLETFSGVLGGDQARASSNTFLLRSMSTNVQTMRLLAGSGALDPDPSKGGGDISIVGSSALRAEAGPSGTLADISVQPESDQISVYVVREGDSLSQIADMFNVTVNTIVWANDIQRGSHIRPGQTLVILPVSGIRHTVESDDTLSSIAEKYDGKVSEIAQYNDIKPDAPLAVGEEIIVPNGEVPQPTPHTRQHYAQQAGSGSPSSGYYVSPVQGGSITQGTHGYNAVDFGAAYGTPVIASAAGKVIIVRTGGWNGGYGNYIVIRHDNGTQTLYAHQSNNIVYPGQHVVQGQVIGYVGSTGRSTGPHVHFEVRGARNPFAY